MFLETFSVTMQKDREVVASRIMEFMNRPEHKDISFELDVKLTSDNSFHCLTFTLIGRTNYGANGRIEGDDEDLHSRISVFAATKHEDRARLAGIIGPRHDDGHVIVLQSSDHAFHCLVYIILEP